MRILTYHKVLDKSNFEKQLKYLKRNNYNVLNLKSFINKIENKESFKKKDIFLTFDDGDYSVFENAMPLLKKYNMAAAVFVITDLINSNKPFWWDEIKYYTGNPNDVRRVKKIKNEERLDYISKLHESKKPKYTQKQLSIKDLKEMESNGISICNHTCSHPMLDKVTEHELDKELSNSLKFLKDNEFEFSNIIAYPNGNTNLEVIKHLEKNQFRLGFVFNHRIFKNSDLPFNISRLSVNDYTPIWKYKLIISGLHSKFLNLKKKLKK